MRQTKKVAVFCSDTLRAMGIQNILSSYFSPIEIANFEELPLNFKDLTSFDYFIVENKVFCESLDFFIPRRQSTLILTDGTKGISSNTLPSFCSIEEIISILDDFFHTSKESKKGEDKQLSSREIEVLKLVVKGNINKEIADILSISFNTVLTHRKNISSKLGIKSVTGLTFYAYMNGYVSSDDIRY